MIDALVTFKKLNLSPEDLERHVQLLYAQERFETLIEGRREFVQVICVDLQERSASVMVT